MLVFWFLFLQNACLGLGLWDILGGLSVVAMAWQSIQPSVDLDARQRLFDKIGIYGVF
jgi:hypothetical protein